MHIYGYHRTSTTDQHLDRGIKSIQDYCLQNNLMLEKIFTDQQTGKNFSRPRYTVMKEDVLKSNDVLIVSELDRLGRNKVDTLKELQFFKEHNIRVMFLDIPTTLIDIKGEKDDMSYMMMETINNLLIELFASFAQAEVARKEKRQREGIAAKKARGEWGDYGRPQSMPFDIFCKEYQRVVNNKIKPFELMKEMKLPRSTFYRYKLMYDKSKNKEQ